MKRLPKSPIMPSDGGLAEYGISVNNLVSDTMVAAYFGRKSLGLKALAKLAGYQMTEISELIVGQTDQRRR